MVPWAGPAVQKPFLKQHQYSPQGQYGRYVQVPQFQQGAQHGLHKAGLAVPGAPQRRPPPTVPPSFQVDNFVRFTGVVSFFAKWKGYGFIEVDQKGVVPGDRLFVHWKQLQSEDRFPFLVKDMQVEFGLMTWRDSAHGGLTLRAKQVTQVGGQTIAMQDDFDAQEKEFVGGQHLRYTGTLKFFTPRQGFGYVVMDQGYDVDPSVPLDLRVELQEVNAGGQQPVFMENIPVEFGIYRNPKGQYLVYNMTLPGGHPLTQDALENRMTMGGQIYLGVVAIWNWRQNWGFIKVEPSVVLPPRVLQKLSQQTAAARARGKSVSNDKMLYFRRADCAAGLNIRQGMQVQFEVYIDDKGAGACDVQG